MEEAKWALLCWLTGVPGNALNGEGNSRRSERQEDEALADHIEYVGVRTQIREN